MPLPSPPEPAGERKDLSAALGGTPAAEERCGGCSGCEQCGCWGTREPGLSAQ
jgi:hypothetical protein